MAPLRKAAHVQPSAEGRPVLRAFSALAEKTSRRAPSSSIGSSWARKPSRSRRTHQGARARVRPDLPRHPPPDRPHLRDTDRSRRHPPAGGSAGRRHRLDRRHRSQADPVPRRGPDPLCPEAGRPRRPGLGRGRPGRRGPEEDEGRHGALHRGQEARERGGRRLPRGPRVALRERNAGHRRIQWKDVYENLERYGSMRARRPRPGKHRVEELRRGRARTSSECPTSDSVSCSFCS